MRIYVMLIAAFAVPGLLSAATLNVPAQYTTIQEAIEAAVNGDTVLVGPGTYEEEIDFLGKTITVESSNGPAVTVIDRTYYLPQPGSVVHFMNNEGADSVLDGFTLTNGTGTYYANWGVIGGGVLCVGASPTIRNNIITNNVASFGAGIECIESASPAILNNIIYDNSVYFHQSGGGIDCFQKSSPLIANNLIFNNFALMQGGGIAVWDTCAPFIVNNTLYENTANTGGGIYNLGKAVILNTILWGNTPNQLSGFAPDIRYCNVQGGYTGMGNIDADPRFVDPDNADFHLTQLSPCINRGTNNGAPSNDPDGDARPFMGTADMGADEFTGTHLLEADTFALSESTGGTVNFTIHGGAANGNRDYITLGSVTGTAPGTPLPGGTATLPLNWDLFTNLVIDFMNSGIFSGFMGTLSPSGSAAPGFNMGPFTGAAGFTLSFAYGLNAPWDFVSNPIQVEITP